MNSTCPKLPTGCGRGMKTLWRDLPLQHTSTYILNRKRNWLRKVPKSLKNKFCNPYTNTPDPLHIQPRNMLMYQLSSMAHSCTHTRAHKNVRRHTRPITPLYSIRCTPLRSTPLHPPTPHSLTHSLSRSLAHSLIH